MHNDDDVKDTQATSNGSTTDVTDKPVNVVDRDLQDRDAEAVDETLTPSSTHAKEQAIEKFKEKIAEIERHVADGN
ncbi:hypothetical protein [Pseudomonas sp. GL-B-19]|uniref:hypothetical protein n=1 Tax=Pseudomonas sp. GL-B-19 TaxID=2832393 RepID=UPI001CBC89C2|nr:hypothetical protein [Pseudomonas sp. GL-B-19]